MMNIDVPALPAFDWAVLPESPEETN